VPLSLNTVEVTSTVGTAMPTARLRTISQCSAETAINRKCNQ